MKLHFSSAQLTCSGPSVLPGQKRREKSEGDTKVIKPTLDPLKAFLVEKGYCFILTVL